MKSTILLFGALFTASLFLGIWIGRQTKPAHHYVQYMQSPYMVDPATGQACNPMPANPQVPTLKPDAWEKEAEKMRAAGELPPVTKPVLPPPCR